MSLRALFLALAILPAAPALACELELSSRGEAVADYVDAVAPCLETPPTGYVFESDMEAEFLDLINEERVSRGLQPLRVRSELIGAARFQSLDMAYNNFFAHVGPDARTPSDRVAAFDRRAFATFAAENVATIQIVSGRWNLERRAVDRLHQNLMDSPGHRENILHPEATHVALGVVKTENGVWVTQVFMTLAGSLSRDAPLRMRAGEFVPAEVHLEHWRFMGFGAEQDGEDTPIDRGVPDTLSGDFRLSAEGRRPSEEPLHYYVIQLLGPGISISG